MDEGTKPVMVELDGVEIGAEEARDELSNHLWGLWSNLLQQPLSPVTKRYVEVNIKNDIDRAFTRLNSTMERAKQSSTTLDVVECLRQVNVDLNGLRDVLCEMVNIFVDHDFRGEAISRHYCGAHKILPILEVACNLQVASEAQL